jgi:hypothetical protein
MGGRSSGSARANVLLLVTTCYVQNLAYVLKYVKGKHTTALAGGCVFYLGGLLLDHFHIYRDP